MVHAFKRSKIAFCLVTLLSAAIIVALWFRDRDHHIIVPIIASALMLGIGYISSRIIANLVASTENTRRLGYLHMELDPQKFLESYQDLPDKVKRDFSTRAIMRSYLADGYAAAGNFEAALETLSEDPPADNLAVRGLYAGNRAACYLNLGDVDQAAEYLAQLEHIIDACRLKKADLASNLTEILKLHKQHLNCLQGKKVDTDYLESAFQRSQYNIRRLEIAKVLAMAALHDGDTTRAKEHLTFLRKNSGKTHFKSWADRQN